MFALRFKRGRGFSCRICAPPAGSWTDSHGYGARELLLVEVEREQGRRLENTSGCNVKDVEGTMTAGERVQFRQAFGFIYDGLEITWRQRDYCFRGEKIENGYR